MNSVSKKLYALIIACVLLLSLNVAVLATADQETQSDPSSTATTAPTDPESDSEDTPASSKQEDADSSKSDPASSKKEQTESDGEDTDKSSSKKNIASATVSMESEEETTEESSKTASATVSTITSTSSKKTTGNVKTDIDDGVDTSGWGEEDTEPESVGVTGEKAGSKKMLNVAQIIWIVIWIPILLIVGSIVALVYVNRKGFVDGTTGSGDLGNGSDPDKKKEKKPSARSRVKNNHSKRTNVYRPRD